MGIEALTIALDGTTVIPTSDDDWDDWVSATALRGYLSGDTLTDWLARYGEDQGFVRDERHAGYDDRLEFPPFIMSKGGEFEQAIAPSTSESGRKFRPLKTDVFYRLSQTRLTTCIDPTARW